MSEEKLAKTYKYWGRKVVTTIIGCVFILIGLTLVKKLKIDIMFYRIYCITIVSLITGYGLQNAGISISSFFKNKTSGG